jgi:hypothetical protein
MAVPSTSSSEKAQSTPIGFIFSVGAKMVPSSQSSMNAAMNSASLVCAVRTRMPRGFVAVVGTATTFNPMG